jgi:spore germination protein GerM
LTQLLETLLALDEQVYGRAGLYHAIYPSELTLEGITIEDGLATINLSGGLAIGGECDEPRIRAQIQQTALQFSNIDDVLILVNGIPYEEVVSP